MALALLALLVNTQPVQAANVAVHVSRPDTGKPVSGAAVCLGTHANPAQFGTGLANGNGIARFTDIPRSELLLTVSKQGHRSHQVTVAGSTANRSLVAMLPTGGGGPSCDATLARAATQPTSTVERVRASGLAIGVRRFRINGGSNVTASPAVTLDFTLLGDVTHYRVSEHPDFLAADWRPVDTDARFELSHTRGQKKLYLQVRKYVSIQGGEIQRVSKVATDTIVLDDS